MNVMVVLLILLIILHLPPSLRRSFPISIFLSINSIKNINICSVGGKITKTGYDNEMR